MSARRLLIIGGITLTVAGMIFGDVFAALVLHQDAGRIGEELTSVTEAVASKDPAAVDSHLNKISGLLENRGTKVDAHVHAIDFGFLALLLALIQPYLALKERTCKRLAKLFLTGAVLLPVSVFSIHYVGLAHSPLPAIGWASILADLGGLFVVIACAGELIGVCRYALGAFEASAEDLTSADSSWVSRVLLTGGVLLILAGFLHGGFYSVLYLESHEMQDQIALETMINVSAAQQSAGIRNMSDAHSVVEGYALIQAEKAVNVAAHTHIIEFGVLAILLALVQQQVALTDRWKKRWAVLLLTGSVLLPVFVLLELQMGIVARGIADVGGLLVIVALIGMLIGVMRNAGRIDAARETSAMTKSRKLLVVSGAALATWGMGFGLYYALFVEHQTLDKMGSSLAASFREGAGSDLIAAHEALQTYANTQFAYVRSVDAHSHWTGLAMLLIVFGVAFDRVAYAESRRIVVAWLLIVGSVTFPLGVALQTPDRNIVQQAVAALGAALVVLALAAVAMGLRAGRNR